MKAKQLQWLVLGVIMLSFSWHGREQSLDVVRMTGPSAVAIDQAEGAVTHDEVIEVLTLLSDPSSPTAYAAREGFEGFWPAANWQLADQSEEDGGEFLWGQRACHPYAGNFGAWSVGGGAQGSQLGCAASYPPKVRTWAVYGPVDLSQAVTASLEFHLWGRSEGGVGCPFDKLYVGSSVDHRVFSGSTFCGDWTNGAEINGFRRQVVDLSERLGESQVWIGFGFISDDTMASYGFTLDDIILNTTGPTAIRRLNLPLLVKAGPPVAMPTGEPLPTLPMLVTATHTPTPTPTASPTPTVTPLAGSGHYVGVTNQGRFVEINLLPGAAAIQRMVLEYQVTCPSSTSTGRVERMTPVGWPIIDRRFEISWMVAGATNTLAGEFSPDFTSVHGTWLMWAIAYNPAPRPICSNTGTWMAAQQPSFRASMAR